MQSKFGLGQVNSLSLPGGLGLQGNFVWFLVIVAIFIGLEEQCGLGY